MEIVLGEQGPHGIVHGVSGISITLCVSLDVVDIAEIGLAFADRRRLSAGFVDKLAEIDGAAELLAVPAVVGKQDIGAEFELVPPVDGGRGYR